MLQVNRTKEEDSERPRDISLYLCLSSICIPFVRVTRSDKVNNSNSSFSSEMWYPKPSTLRGCEQIQGVHWQRNLRCNKPEQGTYYSDFGYGVSSSGEILCLFFETTRPQFYIQLLYKAPLCITLKLKMWVSNIRKHDLKICN